MLVQTKSTMFLIEIYMHYKQGDKSPEFMQIVQFEKRKQQSK